MTDPHNQPQPIPPQGQPYYPPMYYQAPEDEIDLRELFGVLWQGKWWIIGITALFAVVSVFYALSLPNEYKATAIVASASESGGGGLSQMAGQLGGLASLAGVNLGSSETTDAVIAMELLKTWGFVDAFIKKHDLQVAIFAAKDWDKETDQLIIDLDLYDPEQKKWIRDPPRGKPVEPTSWEFYEEFKENLSVGQDKDSGLITISFMHYSPKDAQKIVQWLIEDVNELLQERALDDATKSINYLEEQIKRTSLSDMQNVFYSLIEEQTKNKMLAEVSDEYVFKNVSVAKAPEEKSKPNRVMICVLGILLGGLLSILHIFIRFILGKSTS